MIRAFIIASVFIASPALGSDAARTLLDQGDYAEARALALEADTVDGLNLAGEVMAAEIMLMTIEDPRDHAKAAIKLAEEALDKDPGNIEAKFLRALHTGFRTRSSSAFAIITRGLIGKTRRSIEAFEDVAPNDPRVDALYGAWHLGIVRAAGDGRFGASLEEGMAAYDRAVSARPDDIVVMGNYAFSLIVMEEEQLLPKAAELLEQIAATEAKSATEAETKARMMRLRDVIDDPKALKELSEGLLNTEEVED